MLVPPEINNETWGIAGSIVPAVEMKLVDVPEAGYLSSNSPFPQGEIWVRGGPVSQGYYKNEEQTAEAFTTDGWVKTGDVGEFRGNGSLAIIDRKKNLVKLAQGEYIALEKLESVYKSALYVGNICVFADSLQTRPVAVVLPMEARLLDLAKEMGIQGGFEELCGKDEIKNAVLKSCHEQAKRANFKPVEVLANVFLSPDEWTPQNVSFTI